MYDWANSAYATTTMAAVLPAVFSDTIVPEGGFALAGRHWDGQTLWAFRAIHLTGLDTASCGSVH